MAKVLGRQSVIGIQLENTRGTVETPTTGFHYGLPWAELTVDRKATYVDDKSAIGDIADARDTQVVQTWIEGSIKANLTQKNMPYLFQWVGSDLFSQGTTPDFEHFSWVHIKGTNEYGDALPVHRSYTVFEQNPNYTDTKAYPLAMVDTAEFAFAVGEYPTVTIGFRAKNEIEIVNPVARDLTPWTGDKYVLTNNITAYIDVPGLSYTNPATCVKAFNVTVTKNLEDDYCFGNLAPSDLLNKAVAVEGTIEFLWGIGSYDMADEMVNGELHSISLEGSFADSAKVWLIQFPNVAIKEVARSIGADDFIRQTVTFKAFPYSPLSNGRTSLYEVYVENDVADYTV